MRWPWEKVGEEVDTGHREAKEAFARALEARQRAEQTAAQVEPIMEKLRKRREVNHFTELFEEALKGGKRRDK